MFVVERSGSAVEDALAPLREMSNKLGKDWCENIHVIQQLIANDISSTSIRQLIRQGMSVQYLLPACVIDYIREHGLYRNVEESLEKRSSSMPPLTRKEKSKTLAPAEQPKLLPPTPAPAVEQPKLLPQTEAAAS
jgi:nicotinamide mononucleotide adenylyltransferase